jgi:hypothetical protein
LALANLSKNMGLNKRSWRLFVHGKLLQPSLIFEGKAESYITDGLNIEARVFVLDKPFQHRLMFLISV